jgi:hypothetical protein
MSSMKCVRVFVTVVVACTLAASLDAQDRPDFSGTWTNDRVKSVHTGADGHVVMAAMLGDEFTAKQDATTLTLQITAAGLHVTAVYKLDGSDSTNMSPGGAGQPDVSVVSHATWEGSKLVIRSTSTADADGEPVTIESVRTMFLAADGTFVVDRTGTPASEVQETHSVYTKVK